MRSSGILCVVVLVAGGFTSGLVRAGTSVAPESSSAPYVTRVFFLQAMQAREASTLLRSEVQIVQIATIPDRNILVVSDLADKVNQAESLLRQKDAVVRTVDPHGPLDLRHMEESPTATRVFRIASDDMNAVVAMLRAIYQVRQLNQSPETDSLSLDAAPPVLDSSEALLRELKLLLEPPQTSRTAQRDN